MVTIEEYKKNKILEIGKPASSYENIMGQYIGLSKFSKNVRFFVDVLLKK